MPHGNRAMPCIIPLPLISDGYGGSSAPQEVKLKKKAQAMQMLTS